MAKIRYNCNYCGKFTWKYNDKTKDHLKNRYCNNECFNSFRSIPEITKCSKCNISLHKEELADSGNYRNGEMRKRSWCKECERKRMKNIHSKLRKEAHPCYIASQYARDLGLSVDDLSEKHIEAQRLIVIAKRKTGLINNFKQSNG